MNWHEGSVIVNGLRLCLDLFKFISDKKKKPSGNSDDFKK